MLPTIWNITAHPFTLFNNFLKINKTNKSKVRNQNDDVSISAQWWDCSCDHTVFNTINSSNKMKLIFEILAQCENNEEKLVVFSESLDTLSAIEHFLQMIHVNTLKPVVEASKNLNQLIGTWEPHIDYFRLDGDTKVKTRVEDCDKFNDLNNKRARFVFFDIKVQILSNFLISIFINIILDDIPDFF